MTADFAPRGILPLDADVYHGDPCEVPSLSASIAHRICSQTPLHAWANHPRLNPAYVREEREHFDIGTVVHAAILEPDRTIIQTVYANDWRTKSAREERDEARAEGKIPLLEHQVGELIAMVEAVREQLDRHDADPPLFTDGAAEQTLVWEKDGVVCRARPDWVRTDCRAIDDLKTTSRSANPEAYARALLSVGGDVQAAWYIRGLLAVTGSTRVPDFRWCVVETSPPYAMSVISPAPDVLELGHRKVEYAIGVWRECLASGVWPGYGSEVRFVNAPEWEVARWLEKAAA